MLIMNPVILLDNRRYSEWEYSHHFTGLEIQIFLGSLSYLKLIGYPHTESTNHIFYSFIKEQITELIPCLNHATTTFYS